MERLRLCLNIELDGSAPDWVELIPTGPEVKGRDGRRWLNDNPTAILDAFAANKGPLVIDWEHATELKAVNGEPAPAAGWIGQLESRGGAIWGQVEWTDRARSQIQGREYRFLSPVFLYDKSTLSIVSLSSAGLTNRPNLPLTALNSAQPFEESLAMPLPLVLCQALSLADTATEGEALSAITALKNNLATAQNQALTPPLEKFIPRADYDAALARATNAEKKLSEIEKKQLDDAIESSLQEALAAGKITPATQDYYKAQCHTEGGLEAFLQFVAAAPVVVSSSGLDRKKPEPAKAGKATDTQLAICHAMNLDPAKYLAALAQQEAA